LARHERTLYKHEPHRLSFFKESENMNQKSEKRITSDTGGQKGQKPARFDLIPAPFLWTLALVFGFGSKKYDDDNYRKGYPWKLSYGALQRHLALFWMGEWADDESRLPHLVHAAWHSLVLFMFVRDPKYMDFDDRHIESHWAIKQFKEYTPNYEREIDDAIS
jgi:hypothetical protein